MTPEEQRSLAGRHQDVSGQAKKTRMIKEVDNAHGIQNRRKSSIIRLRSIYNHNWD